MRLTRPLIVIVLATLITGSAFAQGTSGVVPDPITTRELDRYATLLQLSPQQRLALEGPHDAYLSEFGVLRETEIEAYIQESAKLQFGFFGMSAEEIEAALAGREKILRRIRDLDRRLLDSMRVVLTEEQAIRMVRVEQTRERARYGSGLVVFIGRLDAASRIDVADLLDDIELDADGRRAIDDALMRYENALTTARRRLSEKSDSSMRELAKQMERLGIAGGMMRRGGRRNSPNRDAITEYRAVLVDLSTALIADLADIATLNRRTVRDFRPLLEQATWRSVHDAFYERGYKGAGVTDNPGVAFIEAALEEEDLDADTRSTLDDLLVGLYASVDRLGEEAVTLIAAQRAKPPKFLTRVDDGSAEMKEKLEQVFAQREAANDAAIRAATGLLDQDLASRLERRVAAGGDDEEEKNEFASMFDAAPEPQTDPVNAPDPFLPGPISERDCIRYATWLGLDETKHAILNSMHDDYRDSFNEIAAGPVRRVRAAQERLWPDPEDKNTEPPDADAVAAVYRLRRSALDAIVAADTVFFEEVLLVLTDEEAEQMPRVRLDRQRRIFGPRLTAHEQWPDRIARGMNRTMTRSHDEANVDLGTILEDVDPNEILDAARLDALRRAYEKAVAAVYREGYDANLRFQESLDTLGAEGSGPDGNFEWRTFWRKYRTVSEEQGSLAGDAQSRIVTLNRRTLEDLREALTDTAARQAREAYDRVAYPEVFRDEAFALPDIDAALALDDLTPDQRTAIQDIAVEFRAAYDELINQMVAVRTAIPVDEHGWNSERWKQQSSRRRSDERIESDRANLNDKTRLRLKSRLTEDQAARLGL